MKYLVVALEYFTKWIEVESVAQITTHKIQHFGVEEHNLPLRGTEAFGV